jgi:ATP-binding cassette, subfamily B, bacterial MsbA
MTATHHPYAEAATFTQRVRRIAPYFRGNAKGIVVTLLAALAVAVTEPAIPQLIRYLLDHGFETERRFELWMVPVVIVGLFGLRGLANFTLQYALAWVANRGLLNLRHAMFARLLDAAPPLFGRQTTSSLTNTIVYEAYSGAQTLVHAGLVVVRDSLVVVALTAYLLWLNWQLTLAVFVIAPVVALVMRVVSRRLRFITKQSQQATDELGYVVEENVLAWRLVRLHGAQDVQRERFGSRSKRLASLAVKSAAAAAISSPLTQLVAAVALSAVMVVALEQGQGASHTTAGSFVAFITAMGMMIAPLKHLSDVAAPVTRGLAALDRGLDLIEQAPVERGGSHAAERARGAIRFDGVTLRYSGDADADAALDGVTLDIEAGRVVALVGPSGGGKSSLVNLLPRFVEPTAGRVLLDGVPLPEWDIDALRRQFALVSQDVIFFNESVAANVALGSSIDENRVRAALGGANLLDHIERLPGGIHGNVGHNASQLSGGQRQRLAIARAIYKDAPILILDEATSALDSQSERAVQDALERLMRGRTTLVIAHRLSTVEHADLVVVMDRGRVVEHGTPRELQARGGLYAQLRAMQFSPAAARATV